MCRLTFVHWLVYCCDCAFCVLNSFYAYQFSSLLHLLLPVLLVASSYNWQLRMWIIRFVVAVFNLWFLRIYIMYSKKTTISTNQPEIKSLHMRYRILSHLLPDFEWKNKQTTIHTYVIRLNRQSSVHQTTYDSFSFIYAFYTPIGLSRAQCVSVFYYSMKSHW